jgi:hypothetical protein
MIATKPTVVVSLVPAPVLTKQEMIKKWFTDTCDLTNPHHRAAIGRGLAKIAARQTSAERVNGQTTELNGRGFRGGQHARVGVSLAKWYEEKGFLTQKQAALGFSILKCYSRQLSED